MRHLRKSDPVLGSITQKVPYGPESVSYQKKDGSEWPRPPFFWYDTDFSKKKKKILKKSVSYKKKDGCGHARPSFFWYDNDSRL